MCGRFCLTADFVAMTAHFGLHNSAVLRPRYNISPGQVVPLIRRPGELEFMTWGLRPLWLKVEHQAFINARSETLDIKPAFKKAFVSQRCLVIASGYYEWKVVGKMKQPYFIQLSNHKVFAMAGIWDVDGCAVITRPASAQLSVIHERMPVIIAEVDYSLWLNHQTDVEIVKRCMLHDVSGVLATPVSTQVNNPQNDFIECTMPL